MLQPSQGPWRAWGTRAALCSLQGVLWGPYSQGGRSELPSPACGAKPTPQTLLAVEHGNIQHCFEVQFLKKTHILKTMTSAILHRGKCYVKSDCSGRLAAEFSALYYGDTLLPEYCKLPESTNIIEQA